MSDRARRRDRGSRFCGSTGPRCATRSTRRRIGDAARSAAPARRPIRSCAWSCSRRRARGPSAPARTWGRSSTARAASRGWRPSRGSTRTSTPSRRRSICVCVGNVVGAGAELAAAQRPARRRRQPHARLGRRAARRAGRPGAPGAARRARRAPRSSSSPAAWSGWRRRSALGLLHAHGAPPTRPRRAAIELAAEIAAHPPAGLRRLKAMFREPTRAPRRGSRARTTSSSPSSARAPGCRRARAATERAGSPPPLPTVEAWPS